MMIPNSPYAPPHNVLLLSCMDLRLLDETVAFMDGIGMINRYDHVILAGASLGACYDGLPHWGQTFWDHVDIARELHDIREIYILEHRQCGAYLKLLGFAAWESEELEALAHAEVASRLKSQIQVRHSDLGVRAFLMGLSGAVIELAI
ncbi:hypothetical protein V5E97_07840 [Singulisphaera sp. Ch08]|uniref:Carbonic anhydrase n=1 Tax=Singulisphaera sp. Ch08 TaxID=3120278 RepID=A0AAU7CK95_9BACT